MGWTKLEDLELTDTVQCIHCDTRDFHVILSHKEEEKIERSDLQTVLKYPKRFLFSDSEIIDTLKDLKKRSGGSCKWRMLSFIDDKREMVGAGWQFKYLRFYRCEGGFVCLPEEESGYIKKETFKMDINEEYLSSH